MSPLLVGRRVTLWRSPPLSDRERTRRAYSGVVVAHGETTIMIEVERVHDDNANVRIGDLVSHDLNTSDWWAASLTEHEDEEHGR